MSREERDRIAREAAHLYETGREETVGDAIRTAMERASAPEAERPSQGHVRRHIQCMEMQAMGASAYQQKVAGILTVAEEVMTALEAYEPILAGRAAKGHVDGDVTLHVRIYTGASVEHLADELESYGYEDVRIDTINTRWGRLNRLLFTEEGHSVVVTRCLPDMRAHMRENLYRDRWVTVCTLAELRSRLA